MKKKTKYLIFLSVILLLIIVIIILLIQTEIQNHNPVDINSQEQIYYEVQSGAEPLTLAEDLENKEIINSAQVLYKIFLEQGGSLYVNSYVLSPSMTPQEIYDVITSPTSNFDNKNKLLIYEGETLDQIADSLASNLNIEANEVLNYWADTNNLQAWIKQYDVLTDDILDDNLIYPLEGYLYPATYDILASDDLTTITTKILDQTELNYEAYLKKQTPNGLNFHEALTLASIVQRETMTETDEYKVAGVFDNRLVQEMPLQSDITVLYALGEHKEIVTYEDLEVDSPYNTYQNQGLPPGPISSVELTALDAVYNPDNNDYLYFFAKQDTGEVIYSKTLEEHEQVAQQYAWEE
ncbi:MAG: endolytic transglycosylase MltG [Mycoplasmatales bacterium]